MREKLDEMAPLLELRDVGARYGQVQALHGISLTVDDGEIVALLGANGAGKTTTLRAVSGTVKRDGDVILSGKRRTGGPEAMARAGIAHVPEGRGIFAELSVLDNLRMGAYMRRGRPDFTAVNAYFPWLAERGHQQAGTLSGGEQQMLALARAFLSRPRLLMLDEPSLGLAPLVTREVFRVVSELNASEGVAVLVVEQNAAIALEVAGRAYVLETGRIAVAGTAAELRANDAIRAAYLGV
jgi:branched-chain amino acid transport system ATP-binding protein